MAQSLKANGVEVYSGFLLARYNENEEAGVDEVCTVAFTSNTKPLRLDCRAFISFYRKMVDLDAFQGKFLCGRFPRKPCGHSTLPRSTPLRVVTRCLAIRCES